MKSLTLKFAGFLLTCSALLLLTSTAFAAEGGKVRLFILSGQSNMAGLNPAVSFTPALKKAFASDEVIVVKDAAGGQPIRKWYKQWKPAGAAKPAKEPNGKAAKRGKPSAHGALYDRLMKKVRAAIEGKKIDSMSFVWMQGERDAKEHHSKVYAESLRGVIEQLRTDLARPDMTVVIGRLSDHLKKHDDWEGVRAAQVLVAESDKLADWVDTDDLNGPKDGLHYNQAGYATMGERFAEKTIALLQKDGK